MISVAEALARVFDLVEPLGTEAVPLADAAGRVLAVPAVATRDQPPFPAAVMDGYAIADAAQPGDSFRVIGEAAAGHSFGGRLGPGEAARVFTGAPVPEATTRVIIQEDATRDGDRIVLRNDLDPGPYIRPAGADFTVGSRLEAPRRLRPADLALLAAMNVAEVEVTRRPSIALIATGDELVMPGENPSADQIVASNIFALKAMVEGEGGIARVLPIARDNEPALRTVFGLTAGSDMIVTIGGASVGDHDLVARVAGELGLEQAFYKIAMRPGKPLMAGRLQGIPMLGLPGNPVSAIVCAHLFLLPALRAFLGLGSQPAPLLSAPLGMPLPANGSREHYMRARFVDGAIVPFERQDSALLSVLGQAEALLLRPPHDRARDTGTMMNYISI